MIASGSELAHLRLIDVLLDIRLLWCFYGYLFCQIPSKVPIDGFRTYLTHNLDLIQEFMVKSLFQNFVVVSSESEGGAKGRSHGQHMCPQFSV